MLKVALIGADCRVTRWRQVVDVGLSDGVERRRRRGVDEDDDINVQVQCVIGATGR